MFLFEWFLEVVQELIDLYRDNLGSGGPGAKMEKQLRVMFGRGEIDQKTFLRLRGDLEKGYYIEGELQNLHRQGVHRLQREGRYFDHPYNREIARSLETLYLNRARLEEVRLEMDQALKMMEAQQEWLQKQADAIRESAQRALPDESAARTLLEVRQDLLERTQLLESRSGTAQHNLRQLEVLAAELSIAETELLLTDSQEHYATVKLALHD